MHRYRQHTSDRVVASSVEMMFSGSLPTLLLILSTLLLPLVSGAKLATSVVNRDDNLRLPPHEEHSEEAVQRGAQYCQRDDPAFCVSVASKRNSTTGCQDLYVSLLAEPSPKGGWTAVGIGRNMDEALMFIMYSEQSRVRLTTSVRHALGHVMPNPITQNASEVATLQADVNKVGAEYLAAWVCYSCDAWWPAMRSVPLPSPRSSSVSSASKLASRASDPFDDSASQPFIFASNSEQIFYSADAESSLMMHDSNGLLAVDLARASIGDHEPIPSINADGDQFSMPMSNSFGARLVQNSAQMASANRSRKLFISSVQLHGAFMAFSFFAIFTTGAIIVRLPLPPSTPGTTKIIPITFPGSNHRFDLKLQFDLSPVRLHWTFQLLGTLITLFSGIFMLISTLSQRPVRWGFHQSLGSFILLAIATQAALGWRNHVTYLRKGPARRTARTLNTIHRWLGRFVLCLGVFNVGVGMWYRGFGPLGLGVWSAVVGVEVLAYLLVVYFFPRGKEGAGSAGVNGVFGGKIARRRGDLIYSDALIIDGESGYSESGYSESEEDNQEGEEAAVASDVGYGKKNSTQHSDNLIDPQERSLLQQGKKKTSIKKRKRKDTRDPEQDEPELFVLESVDDDGDDNDDDEDEDDERHDENGRVHWDRGHTESIPLVKHQE